MLVLSTCLHNFQAAKFENDLDNQKVFGRLLLLALHTGRYKPNLARECTP